MSEYVAALLLISKHHKIIKVRHKTKEGEIDIISIIDDCVVFTEVKHRKNLLLASESVTGKNLERILNAASLWMSENCEYANFNLRVDVILIHTSIEHMENINLYY